MVFLPAFEIGWVLVLLGVVLVEGLVWRFVLMLSGGVVGFGFGLEMTFLLSFG